jgi:dienelactone hydrolase
VIKVTPAVGLFDQPRTIVISHLRSAELVTVTAKSQRSSGVWSASASFKADRTGVVDVARTAPVSGSYRVAAPMGLFWAQHRVGSRSAGLGATVTSLAVTAGSHRLATAQVTQLLSGPGVTARASRVDRLGFYGEYFAPAGRGRRPGVVIWGGSEGGLSDTGSLASAALLASHGIPALAIAYFDEPGLHCSLSDIPLEYFVRAIRWLGSQPQVAPNRVWVISGSRGSELLVASYWTGLVHGVVADAPSSEVYGAVPGNCPPNSRTAWTLHGRPLAQAATKFGDAIHQPDGSIVEEPAFRAGLADLAAASAAAIPVQRIKGPVLLISGGDDQLWPSDTYAERIMKALSGDPSPHVHVNFPAAGHLVFGIPYEPSFTRASVANGRAVIDLGGTSAADSAARARDWPDAIAFISGH